MKPRDFIEDPAPLSDSINLNNQEIINGKSLLLNSDWSFTQTVLEESSKLLKSVIFLYDFKYQRFLYISDNVKDLVGTSSEEILSKDIEFSKKFIHPEYQEAINQIKLKSIEYYENSPLLNRENTMFFWDYLCKNPNYGYIRLIQKTRFLKVDKDGSPLVSLNFATWIGNCKKEPSSNLIIAPPGRPCHIFYYNFTQKQLIDAGAISSREKEILYLLSQGFDSQSISEKLFISKHTVNTHRSNILRKTQCRDTSALFTFCRMTGLI